MSLRTFALAAVLLGGLAAYPLVDGVTDGPPTASTPESPAAGESDAAMLRAANAFLAALDPAQRQKATIPFNSEERLNWHFIPRERKGLSLKDMTAVQREAALELLRAGLSARGFSKAETVRSLEMVLRELGGSPSVRDPELYFFSIFGEPSPKTPWGWRYEGHHLSQNWTLTLGRAIATTPQFFGANPAEVRSGTLKGTRALAAEEDLARSLLGSLTAAQRADALVGAEAPRDIVTGNSRQAAIQDNTGIAYSALGPEQQGMLLSLVEEYAGAQPRDVAAERLAQIRKAGLGQVTFAWMGGLERGQGHYYRIQGPTFLIEYDNTQNDANHIHAVWRDFKNDFGLDALGAHYRSTPH